MTSQMWAGADHEGIYRGQELSLGEKEANTYEEILLLHLTRKTTRWQIRLKPV